MPLNVLHTCIWAAWIWSSTAEQLQSVYDRSAPAPSLIQQTKQLQEPRGDDVSGNPTSESEAEAPAPAPSLQATPSKKLALTGLFCGFVGGALGGLAALVAEIINAKNGVSTGAISLLVGGFFGAAFAGISHVGVFPVVKSILGQANEGPTRFFDESLFEKLESLANVAATVAGHEEQTSETLEEKKKYTHDKVEAYKILNDLYKIESEAEKSPEETHKALMKDFHELEEVLSHGHTSEFETAETAADNLAILTEQDIAKIEGDRGEDTGVENATENGQGTSGHAEEGDMISEENQTGIATLLQHTWQATRLAAGLTWTDAVVNYCIAPDVSTHMRHLVSAAMSSLTRGIPCLKFVDVGHKKGSSQSPSKNQLCKKSPAIFIQSNPFEHCYAYVGMVDFLPSQTLQIQEPHCASLGVIKHELGHALGMAHEQARIDRDSHVTIHWRNIKGGKEGNFEIRDKGYIEDDYDILSIMHYDNYAFARDPSQVTIEEIGATTHDVMGQRSAMAISDMHQLADMYRQENPQCVALATTGIGCLDALDRNGNDVCSNLKRCNSQAVSLCCACGGGIKVQCYHGSPCPTVPALPPPEGSDCLEDVTYHFGNAYPCIYRNRCDFNVNFKCPGLTCEHTAKAGKITMTYCGSDVQTEICEPSRCQVYPEE